MPQMFPLYLLVIHFAAMSTLFVMLIRMYWSFSSNIPSHKSNAVPSVKVNLEW